MASTIDTAVDAAEDLPHFWINTPPLWNIDFSCLVTKLRPNRFDYNHRLCQIIRFINHESENIAFWTFSVNSSSNHLMSLMTSLTGKPLILAFRKSGTWWKLYWVFLYKKIERILSIHVLKTESIRSPEWSSDSPKWLHLTLYHRRHLLWEPAAQITSNSYNNYWFPFVHNKHDCIMDWGNGHKLLNLTFCSILI